MTSAANQRDQSLDSLRGTDVLLMIVVNVQGSDDAAFPLLKHADWNGLTLADLVFPVFLLIVGLSVPLALDKPNAIFSWAATLRRAALMSLIGVGLSWLIRPTLDPELIRWTGVLQRIAIVYLACAIIAAIRRGPGLSVAIAAVCLALHSWMILTIGAPSGGGPDIGPGMGISGWLDQNFIPGRVLRTTWEPEGILSTIPAIATGLIGVGMMRATQVWQLSPATIGLFGLSFIVAGLTITPVLPLNKNLWTASFALVTSGVATFIWAGIRSAWPRIGSNPIARWTVTLGQAALTLYVIHTLLIAVIVRKLPDGTSIWDTTYQILAASGLPPPLAALTYACIAAALSCAALPSLVRRGWVLKV